MFGLVLSFAVCLSAGEGGRCQNVELPFEGSMQQCALFGQHQAARWTYIGSGMVHDRFKATLQAMSPNAAARIAEAAPLFA